MAPPAKRLTSDARKSSVGKIPAPDATLLPSRAASATRSGATPGTKTVLAAEHRLLTQRTSNRVERRQAAYQSCAVDGLRCTLYQRRATLPKLFVGKNLKLTIERERLRGDIAHYPTFSLSVAVEKNPGGEAQSGGPSAQPEAARRKKPCGDAQGGGLRPRPRRLAACAVNSLLTMRRIVLTN
jgi:hypothetical protein